MTVQDMEYLAFGPEAGPARRLVVLVHGYGRNASSMQKMADEVLRAVPDARVICPQGVEVFEVPADQNSSEVQRQWFSMRGDLFALYPRLTAAATAMNKFIDGQRDALNLTDRDVAVMGFSQGASLSLYTSFTRASEIAGAICHSSILLSQPDGDIHLRSKPRTLFIYGSNDKVFPQELYEKSLVHVQNWTGNATGHRINGLDHTTNSGTRAVCAQFIRNCFNLKP